MDIRRYMPRPMLGEYWIYAIGALNSIVLLIMLQTMTTPIRFGIW
jgi:hypothetical protein